jgi:hypothetical protein
VNDFWVCPACRSLNRGRAKECYSCHAPYAPFDDGSTGGGSGLSAAAGSAAASPATSAAAASGAGSFTVTASPAASSASLAAPGGAFLAGASSAGSADAGGPAGSSAAGPTGPAAAPADDSGLGLPGAIVGGAVGAIVSAALWYLVVTATHVQAGIVAIAVGWIVGQAVVLASGRRSLDLVAVSVTWTALALVAAQYLIAIRLLNDLLVQAGADFQLPLFVSPGATVDVVVAWLQDDPLTLVFWAIALFEAVVIPWRRAMRTTPSRWSGPIGSPAMPR